VWPVGWRNCAVSRLTSCNQLHLNWFNGTVLVFWVMPSCSFVSCWKSFEGSGCLQISRFCWQSADESSYFLMFGSTKNLPPSQDMHVILYDLPFASISSRPALVNNSLHLQDISVWAFQLSFYLLAYSKKKTYSPSLIHSNKTRQYPLLDQFYLTYPVLGYFWRRSLLVCFNSVEDVQGLDKIMETLQILYTFLY
jgi:hypothetical protein